MRHDTALDGIDPVALEAARWFTTLRDAPDDVEVQAAFAAWIEADPHHAAAFARLAQLWDASGQLPSLAAAGTDRRAVLRGSVAAGVALVAGLGAGRLLLGPHPFADHRTGAGEWRSVALADGSRVELSTATALSLEYGARERRIHLHAGEAWFGVARDPGRPFVVEAAGGTVTALGTGFAVALAGGGAEVSVTEHAVGVALAEQRARIGAGQRVRYGADGLEPVVAADPNALAWREGRLVFVDRPLGEVAAALDRWTGSTTIVTDNALARRPVTLMIAASDAAQGIARLAEVLPLRVTRLAGLVTLISGR